MAALRKHGTADAGGRQRYSADTNAGSGDAGSGDAEAGSAETAATVSAKVID